MKNLLNIKQSKGSHSIKWHDDSDGSSKLGSGIYFIMINIGTATEFKKVILIK